MLFRNAQIHFRDEATDDAGMETFAIFAILCLVFIRSSATPPVLVAIPDIYEVRSGGHALKEHYDSVTERHWKTKASLDRLELLLNDLAYNLPFETCIEEKMTRENKFADQAGQSFGFEEVHQVQLILYTWYCPLKTKLPSNKRCGIFIFFAGVQLTRVVCLSVCLSIDDLYRS